MKRVAFAIAFAMLASFSAGAQPIDVEFGMTTSEVREVLGEPDQQGIASTRLLFTASLIADHPSPNTNMLRYEGEVLNGPFTVKSISAVEVCGHDTRRWDLIRRSTAHAPRAVENREERDDVR